jgi:hypothetical protein
MVNSLSKLIGREPIYTSVEPAHAGTVLRTDEFYGKALTAVARTLLERRNAAGLGAVSVDALYSDLVRGGFQFDAKNEANAKRSLAIQLAKNSYLFHRLPNGDWGLVNWYEKLPAKTKANGNKDEKAEKEDRLEEPYPHDFEIAGQTAEVKVEEARSDASKKEQKPARKPRDLLEDAARVKAMVAEHPEVQMAAREL